MNEQFEKWSDESPILREFDADPMEAAEAAWEASHWTTREAVLEEVWDILHATPYLDIEGYKFRLLNRRQVLGSVNELLTNTRKAKPEPLKQ